MIESTPPKQPNPFVNKDFKFRVWVFTDTKELVNIGTNLSPVLVPKEIIREGESHTKVFHSKELMDIKLRLSPSAYKLLSWIEMKIDRNCDWITINKRYFLHESRLSAKSYKRGIDELLDTGIICECRMRNTYFINPKYFFFGSRPDKYPGHIRR